MSVNENDETERIRDWIADEPEGGNTIFARGWTRLGHPGPNSGDGGHGNKNREEIHGGLERARQGNL